MLALQYQKSIPRYLLVHTFGKRFPRVCCGAFSCIRLVELSEPELPGPSWVKLRTRLCGICGSDLAVITCSGSPYFSPLTSTPFVLGHEVVADVVEVGEAVGNCQVGERVVIEPALSCRVRGQEEICQLCRRGHYANCEKVMKGDISPGIQTGYCRDTGGGASSYLLAHDFQIHRIPNEIPDESAVLIEPFSCALHAVLKGMGNERQGIRNGRRMTRHEDASTLNHQPSTINVQPSTINDNVNVVVIGCGTMGLLTIAALRAVGYSSKILAIAKHSHQRELAKRFGADEVAKPRKSAYEAVLEFTGATSHQPEVGKPVLIGGADVSFECVGAASTIDDALRFTRAQGKVVLVGMPAIPKNVDWTSIWYKELNVMGAYAYGMESWDGQPIRTFELALRLIPALRASGTDIGSLVTHKFPLSQYRQAILTALKTSKSGSVKTVFVFT